MNFSWKRAESELDREIADHLRQLTAEYERQGYAPEEAKRLAKREFGGGEQIKERCRDERRFAWANGLRQDIVFGCRMMRRTPVVTAAAVLSLALAIGASTAIVSIMDVVMWHDLPLPDPQQIVNVNWRGHGFPEMADSASGSADRDQGWYVADFFSYNGFQVFQQRLAGKASVAAFAHEQDASVSFSGEAGIAHERLVSGNFFSTLKIKPEMGRLLSNMDDRYAAAPAVCVSHAYWVKALHSAPQATGKTLTINNREYTIAGVLERSFSGLFPGDLSEIYVPLHQGFSAGDSIKGKTPLDDERNWGLQLIARREGDFSERQMQATMDTVFPSSWSRQPKDAANTPHVLLNEGRRGLGFLRENFRNPLLVLGGLVGLLLLIACTNIANLLLSRGAARQREVATRISLGCGRARLMRQFLTESALLALFGGIGSIAVAYVTQGLFAQFVTSHRSGRIAVGFGAEALAIILATTLLALAIFGIFPAWRASAVPSAETLKNWGGSVGYRSRRRWNSGRAC